MALFKQQALTATVAALIAVNLGNLDLAIVVDQSGSMVMSSNNMPNGQTRWAYTKEIAALFTEQMGKYDDDGVDFYFFNNGFTPKIGVKPETFQGIWDSITPGGGTGLLEVLKASVGKALERIKGGSEKQQFVVVFTDGEPNQNTEEAIAQYLADATKQLQRKDQLCVLFLQVGYDKKAEAFLAKLNDNLGRYGARYDCVACGNVDEIVGKQMQDIANAAFNG